MNEPTGLGSRCRRNKAQHEMMAKQGNPILFRYFLFLFRYFFCVLAFRFLGFLASGLLTTSWLGVYCLRVLHGFLVFLASRFCGFWASSLLDSLVYQPRGFLGFVASRFLHCTYDIVRYDIVHIMSYVVFSLWEDIYVYIYIYCR